MKFITYIDITKVITFLRHPFQVIMRTFTTCKYYTPVFTSFITYHWVCNEGNTTRETGTAHPSGAPEYIPLFSGGSCCSIFSFLCFFVDEYFPFFLVIVLFFYLFTASDYIVLYFYFYNIIGRLQLTQDSAIRYSFGIDNIFLQITAKVQGNMILHYAL